MGIRIKSGQIVNIIIMEMPICWTEGDEPYSYVETISDKLIKDLVLSSNHKILESKTYHNEKVYSLDGLNNEMYQYFENYGMWSKTYERMLIVTFLDLENTIFEHKSVSEETVDFLKSLDSIIFRPLPIWRSTILGNGIDSPAGIDGDFIEIRGHDAAARCVIDRSDTWRSIIDKTNKLVRDSGKRSDVFLEGYDITDRILRPYLGS